MCGLVILCVLSEISFPLAASRVSRFVLSGKCAACFHLRSTLTRLASSKLLGVRLARGHALCGLARRKTTAVGCFEGGVSPRVHRRVSGFVGRGGCSLGRRISIGSSCCLGAGRRCRMGYRVLRGNSRLVSVALAIPARARTRTVMGG